MKRPTKPTGKSILEPAVYVACVIALGSLVALRNNSCTEPAAAMDGNASSHTPRKDAPRTLAELLDRALANPDGCDIGLMNLLCAEGLRGAEALNVREHLERLDGIARRVDLETQRAYYKFRNSPSDFQNSEAYFHMLYLFTVVQADVRIRYNPERITPVGLFEVNEVFFADSRDVFIHGLVADDRRMGTCASMPVLYVAIGRRLGYPIKLVPTKNRFFIRWEDTRERVNFDGTGRGMSVFDDNHYRQWPFPVSKDEEEAFGYLKSMSPAEELTAFLSLRGHCLLAMGRHSEAVATHQAALRISPHNRQQQLIAAQVQDEGAYRSARADFIPLEQLQRGVTPVWINSHELEVARVVRQAQQLGRHRPDELPGTVHVNARDPQPLRKLQNQFKSP